MTHNEHKKRANRPSERDTLIVAVQKAFDALADDGWISCEDRLPEEERWVYFMETEKDVEIAWYAGGWFKTNNDLAWTDSEDCLYWKYIPLPKPYRPKEDK